MRYPLILGIAVVVGWGITMGFLYRNHYAQTQEVPRFDEAEFFQSVKAVEKWQDVNEFMVVKHNNTVVGGSVNSIVKLDSPDKSNLYKFRFVTQLKISELLPPFTVRITGTLDDHQNLSAFHANADLGVTDINVSGQAVSKTLYLKTNTGTGPTYQKLLLKNPVNLAGVVRPALGKHLEIRKGNRMAAPVIDPLTGETRGTLAIVVGDQEDVRVGDKNVRLHKVTSTLGDIQTSMWVDDAGLTHKRQLVGSYTMERSTSEIVAAIVPSLWKADNSAPIDFSEFRNVELKDSLDLPSENQSAFKVLQELIN